MNQSIQRCLTLLDTALDMEQKGQAFYTQAAAQTQDKLGRQMFETLMHDEINHQERIRKIAADLKTKQAWTDDWKCTLSDNPAIKTIFATLTRQAGSESAAQTSDLEALEVGIRLEQESITFYENQATAATDPLEHEFLVRMVAEEKAHHIALEDMLFYLKDPQSWFTEHEHHGLDGG